MKRFLNILPLVFLSFCALAQNPNPLAYSYSTLGEMRARKAAAYAKATVEGVRGGNFTLLPSSVFTIDSGTVMSSAVAGYYWVRQFDKAKGLNAKWFADNIGDSVTDTYAAFQLMKQAAINWKISTINFPTGKYANNNSNSWLINQDNLTLKGDGIDKTILLPPSGTTNGSLQMAPYRDQGWILTPSLQYTYEDTAYIGQNYVRMKAGQDLSAFAKGTKIYINDGASYYDQYYGQNDIVDSVAGNIVFLRYSLGRDYTSARGNWYGQTTADFVMPAVNATVTVSMTNPPPSASGTYYGLSINNNLYEVTAVTANSATLRNVGKGNLMAGTTIPSGSHAMKSRAIYLTPTSAYNSGAENLTVIGRRRGVVISNSIGTKFKDVKFVCLPAADNGQLWLDGDDGIDVTFDGCTIKNPSYYPSQPARSFGLFKIINNKFINAGIDFTEFNWGSDVAENVFSVGTNVDSVLTYPNNPIVCVGGSTTDINFHNNTIYSSLRTPIANAPDIQIFKNTSGNNISVTNNKIFMDRCPNGIAISRSGSVTISNNKLFGTVTNLFYCDGGRYSDTSNLVDNNGQFNFINDLKITGNTFGGNVDAFNGKALHNAEVSGNVINRQGAASPYAASINAAGNILINTDSTKIQKLFFKNNTFIGWYLNNKSFNHILPIDTAHEDISLNYFFNQVGTPAWNKDTIITLYTPYDNRYAFKGAVSGGTVSNVTGTSPIIITGTSTTTPNVAIQQANASQPGYLSSADWSTFNAKQPAGSYLTANQNITLSGDVTGSGTTAITTTLPNTGVTAGSYTNSNVTVDAKGRITNISNGSAGSGGTLTGTRDTTVQGITTHGVNSGNTVAIVPSFNYLLFPKLSARPPVNNTEYLDSSGRRSYVNNFGYNRTSRNPYPGDMLITDPFLPNPILADSNQVAATYATQLQLATKLNIADTASQNARNTLQYVTSKGYTTTYDLNTSANSINMRDRSVYSILAGDTTLSTAKKSLICFGNSITAGDYYRPRLSKMLSQVDHGNYGIPGTKLQSNSGSDSSLVNRTSAIPTYDSTSMSYLVVEITSNDINNPGSDTASGHTAYTTIINAAKAKNWTGSKIVLCTTGMQTLTGVDQNKLQGYRQLTKKVAAEQGTIVADWYAADSANGGGKLLADGLHPTPEGAQVRANAIAAAIGAAHGGNLLVNGNVYSNGLVVTQNQYDVPAISIYDTSRQVASEIRSNVVRTDQFFGLGAGAVSTGYYNHGFGYGALGANTTGYYNTAVGYKALALNNTGSANTAMGYMALGNARGNVVNTAFGELALSSDTSGTNNAAFGVGALGNNITGSNNIGIQGLSANTTGSNNIGIGGNANTTGGNNVGVGIGAIGGTATSFNTAMGNGALGNVTGNGNAAFGYGAGQAVSSGGVAAVGYNAANATNTGNAAAFGNNALLKNTTGTNTAVGNASLLNNTTGSGNTAMGNSTLSQCIVGNYNTGIGQGATNVTSGITSVPVGNQGTGYSTATIAFSGVNGASAVATISGGKITAWTITAAGFGAPIGTGTVTGTVSGDGTGATVTNITTGTGSYNTGLGYTTGSAFNTGSNNTLIGAGVGSSTSSGYTNLSNQVWIGNNLGVLLAGAETGTLSTSTLTVNGTEKIAVINSSSNASDLALVYGAGDSLIKSKPYGVTVDNILSSASSSYTIPSANSEISLSAPSAAATLTLPTGSSYPGQHIIVVNATSPANANQWSFPASTVVDGAGSSITTIAGYTTYYLENVGGTTWRIIASQSAALSFQGIFTGSGGSNQYMKYQVAGQTNPVWVPVFIQSTVPN